MSAIQQALVAIMYIGFRPFWEDTIYGTGLTFETGQVRKVPPYVATNLLRHADAFRKCVPEPAPELGLASDPDTDQQDSPATADTGQPATDADVPDGEGEAPAQDDTQELIDQAEKQEQEQKDEAERNCEALQMIDGLATKAAIAEYAETHYQAKINQRLSLDNMRSELRALVEKFGVI